MEAGQLPLLLEVELEPRLGILQVTKFYGGHGCLEDGPKTPKEMGCQSIPIDLYQQIFFQFLLLLSGDGLTFFYLRQVMANKMKLTSTDESQEISRLWSISQLTPLLIISFELHLPHPL